MRRMMMLLGTGVLLVAALPASLAMAADPPPEAPPEGIEIEGPGRIRLHGAGTLEAEGRGFAHLQGDLSFEGAVMGGTLTVDDHDAGARVYVERFAARHVSADGSVTYLNPQGRVRISGPQVEVTIRAATMRFHARGRGVAELAGNGWFSINGGPRHMWPAS